MSLLNDGRDALTLAIIGSLANAFDNTNALLGVGDATSVFDATHTDLQAATNKAYKGMEAGYPTQSLNAIAFRSLFATNQANFAWEEWVTTNESGPKSSGYTLNRKVESLGTKTSAQQWQLTCELTIVNSAA